MTSFEYLYTMQSTGQLDIEDLGNCAVVGYNSTMYTRYILIIKTINGKTKIVISGPHWTEIEEPCAAYSYDFQVFDFSASKIEKIIDKFLNSKFLIDQAQEVAFEEAIKYIPDVREYIIND